MGKTETIKERTVWIYVPTLEQKNQWDEIATSQSMSLSKWIIKTIEDSLKFSKDEIKDRENKKCGISYVGLKQKNQQGTEFGSSPELYIWSLGLICEYWLLFLFKQKSIEGHCYNHKKPCV